MTSVSFTSSEEGRSRPKKREDRGRAELKFQFGALGEYVDGAFLSFENPFMYTRPLLNHNLDKHTRPYLILSPDLTNFPLFYY
jgi:hypothetical protein